jgi:hypothetical protein
MKELGITKGGWVGVDYAGHYSIQVAPFYGARDLLDKDETNEAEANMQLCCDAGNTAQKCGLLPSELLQQRDELKEALAEQKRLYFSLFDEETSCMYCEAKIRRGSAIILCKECAENTEV